MCLSLCDDFSCLEMIAYTLTLSYYAVTLVCQMCAHIHEFRLSFHSSLQDKFFLTKMFIGDILNEANVSKYVLSIKAKMHGKFHSGKPLQCHRANLIMKKQCVF